MGKAKLFGVGGVLVGLVIVLGLVFMMGLSNYAAFFVYQFLPVILTTLAIIAIIVGLMLLIYG